MDHYKICKMNRHNKYFLFTLKKCIVAYIDFFLTGVVSISQCHASLMLRVFKSIDELHTYNFKERLKCVQGMS